jgi:hypothetical protein
MDYSPDDNPEALVHEALAEAAALASDPAVKDFCQAYRSGAEAGFSVERARAALLSVWPELAKESIDSVWSRMEADGQRSLSEAEVARWAMAGALRAALEQLVTHKGQPATEAVLYRRRQAGMVAFKALLFAETARALRREGPGHPPRFQMT